MPTKHNINPIGRTNDLIWDTHFVILAVKKLITLQIYRI